MIQLVAYITMIIDHLGQVFFPGDQWFILVGRVAFPLFAWMIGYGAIKSRNLDKYILRVFALGILSQIPFLTLFPGHLNICFTLGLGLLFFRCWWSSDVWGFLVLATPLLVPVSYGPLGVLFVFGCCLASYYRHPLFALVAWVPVSLVSAGSLPWVDVLVIGSAVLILATVWRGRRWLPGRLAYWIYPGHLLIFALARHSVFGA